MAHRKQASRWNIFKQIKDSLLGKPAKSAQVAQAILPVPLPSSNKNPTNAGIDCAQAAKDALQAKDYDETAQHIQAMKGYMQKELTDGTTGQILRTIASDQQYANQQAVELSQAANFFKSKPTKQRVNPLAIVLFISGLLLASLAIVLFATGILAPIGGLSAWASAALVASSFAVAGLIESSIVDAIVPTVKTLHTQHKKHHDSIVLSTYNPIPSLTQFCLGTLPSTVTRFCGAEPAPQYEFKPH